jgi:hypothetical protein
MGYSVPEESPVSRANAYPYCHTSRRVSNRTSTLMVWGEAFVGRATSPKLYISRHALSIALAGVR